jgi:hypothetical protein
MQSNFILSTSIVAIACLSAAPARADDQKTTTVQAKNPTSHLVALPRAIAGFCAGVVVGTPICFARKFPQELSEGAHGFLGSIVSNDDKKELLLPAYVVWLPVAGVVTALEAPGYAIKDAYTAEKAFSKEQFSLGEMDP